MKRWFAVALSSAALWAAALPARASAQNFSVSAPNMTDYSVNGQPDPRLTLIRGSTYTFAVNAPGHPFFIKTTAGSGTANQFSDGVTGNGTTAGTLTFIVPQTAPSTLFYQCSVHAAMGAQIDVVNATAAPALGAGRNVMLLMLLVTASAAAAISRSRRSSPANRSRAASA
jgi:hypothetical protein